MYSRQQIRSTQALNMIYFLYILLWGLWSASSDASRMTVCKQLDSLINHTSVEQQYSGQTVFLETHLIKAGPKGDNGEKGNTGIEYLKNKTNGKN